MKLRPTEVLRHIQKLGKGNKLRSLLLKVAVKTPLFQAAHPLLRVELRATSAEKPVLPEKANEIMLKKNTHTQSQQPLLQL